MARVYCHHCGKRIDRYDVFCPECGRSLVGSDAGWQDFKLQESIFRVKRRADVYTALAAVLATLGLLVGVILGVLSDPIALFGISFLCLGIGFASSAKRHDRRADDLARWVRR